MNLPLVKVTSPSFSKNPALQAELARRPFRSVLNTDTKSLPASALVTYLADADAAILSLDKINDAVLDQCPRLRAIAKFGVGLDNIDLDACNRRGIAVFCPAGVNRRSVAEVALGAMLGLSHNVFSTMQDLKLGKWNKDGGRELTGKTVGIIGLGQIGRELVELLKPFRCRILGNDVADVSSFAREHGITLATREEIFRNSDFVTLHLPFSADVKHLINDETLRMFRPGAYLINTSRGQIVDQQALKRALQSGTLTGAALDDMDFLQLPNLVCTPHISGVAYEAVVATGIHAIDYLDTYFRTAHSTR